MPAISCATVALDPSKYTHLLPILVSAAADWSDVADRSSVYTANSVQTWVNGTELTICLYVVGAPPSQLPRVVWVAYQENLQYRTSGTMVGGTIVVDTFVSGSVCAMVNLPVSIFTEIQSTTFVVLIFPFYPNQPTSLPINLSL